MSTAATLLTGRGRRAADTWPGLPELPAAWVADPDGNPIELFEPARRD